MWSQPIPTYAVMRAGQCQQLVLVDDSHKVSEQKLIVLVAIHLSGKVP